MERKDTSHISDVIKCPRSGQYSSKRVISIVCLVVAVVVTFIYLFSDGIHDEKRQYISDIIKLYLYIAAGSQAMTKSLSLGKNNTSDGSSVEVK